MRPALTTTIGTMYWLYHLISEHANSNPVRSPRCPSYSGLDFTQNSANPGSGRLSVCRSRWRASGGRRHSMSTAHQGVI